MKRAARLFASFRILYTFPFVLAVAAGSAPLLTVPGSWVPALLMLLEAFLFGLFVNLFNDLEDHRNGTDRLRFDLSGQERELLYGPSGMLPEELFWQGNPFDLGLIGESGGKRALGTIIALMTLLLFPLTLLLGRAVLLCTLLALALGYAYSGKPFSLDRRGFGELLTGAGFILLAGCASFLLRGELHFSDAARAGAIGASAFVMRGADSLTGWKAHQAAGERDIGVRFGPRRAAGIFSAAALLPHAAALSVWAHSGRRPEHLLPLMALPLSLRIIRILKREAARPDNAPARFVPAVVPSLIHFFLTAFLAAGAALLVQ